MVPALLHMGGVAPSHGRPSSRTTQTTRFFSYDVRHYRSHARHDAACRIAADYRQAVDIVAQAVCRRVLEPLIAQ